MVPKAGVMYLGVHAREALGDGLVDRHRQGAARRRQDGGLSRRQGRYGDRQQQQGGDDAARHRLTEDREDVVGVVGVVEANADVAETGEGLNGVGHQDVGAHQDQGGDDGRDARRLAGGVLGLLAHGKAGVPAPIDEDAQDDRRSD